jgi:hypothetical protein
MCLEKNKKISQQVERWDLIARLMPTSFLVVSLILVIFDLIDISQAFYIGIFGFTVTAVTWWWWAIFTIKYLITTLNRASTNLQEVNEEIKSVKLKMQELKDES